MAECTVANDVLGVTQDGTYCEMGKGPGICLRDNGLIPNRRLFQFMTGLAEREAIPFQYVSMERGTTDGTPIQVHGVGVPTIYIGTPVRYVHSQAGIVDETDFDQTVQLLVETVLRLDEEAVASLTHFGA